MFLKGFVEEYVAGVKCDKNENCYIKLGDMSMGMLSELHTFNQGVPMMYAQIMTPREQCLAGYLATDAKSHGDLQFSKDLRLLTGRAGLHTLG